MITNFKKFFEAKIRDLINFDSGSDSLFRDYTNKTFKNDTQLISKIFLKKNSKFIFIKWNNNIHHDMIQKIKDRTTFINISEFNEFFKELMINLFENKFNELEFLNQQQNYITVCIKDNDNDYIFPMSYKFDDVYEEYTEIFIKTITLTSCNDNKSLVTILIRLLINNVVSLHYNYIRYYGH